MKININETSAQILEYWGWLIIGNKHIAIAINLEDETDTHHFERDPEVNNDAFTRALGWAYPGPIGW